MYTCDLIAKVQRVHMRCIFHGHLERLFIVKRDLIQCQKRPITVSKGVHMRCIFHGHLERLFIGTERLFIGTERRFLLVLKGCLLVLSLVEKKGFEWTHFSNLYTAANTSSN
jgi:hypothetical protein